MADSLELARLKDQNPIEEVAGQYGITFSTQGRGRCPFHERHNNGDANPSLRLDRGRQRLRCESQNCFDGAVDVIGLVMKLEGIPFKAAREKLAQRAGLSNGHTSPPAQGSSRIVATYDYRDEAGNLLYQMVRKEPGRDGHGKDFVIRRPDGNGGWIWKQGDVRLVPYRLPDLLKTAGPVVVVEGEKCADTLWNLNVAATCNPFGAGKWREEFNTHLSGRDVILWADKDEVGCRHMEEVAQSLQGVAASIRRLRPPAELPDKGDVADGVQKLRWTREDVRRFLEGAQPWEPASMDSTQSVPAAEDSEWPDPQPLPDALPPVEPFAPALLPEAFRPWIEDIADRMQCPPDYPAVGAVVALSAAVGRQLAIRPKAADDWTVVPNLWGAVVGRPGLLKTPALQEVRQPLDRLEGRAREAYEQAQRDHEAQGVVAEARQKEGREKVRRAVRDGKDPSELALLLVGEQEPPPARRRYIVHDPTVEKLGEILRDNPRGVLIFRDELTGFLRTMDREGHESDRAFYLEAWNGNGRFSYDRIGRGTIDIDAACVSLLGGIQPGPLSVYMARAAGGGGGDDGLVQRFQLLTWPDSSRDWANVDRAPDAAARRQAFAVFERLDGIDPVAVGAGVPSEGGLPFLRFTPAAQEMFTEWRTELESRLRSGELPSLLEGHLAKYRSLIPSLALLIHLADVGAGPVGEEALCRAGGWGEYLETHARRVYAPALSPTAGTARALADKILKGELGADFRLGDVQRKGWAGLGEREEIAAGLELLEDLDWLRAVREPTAGRPRTGWQVNPKVKEG